MLDQLFAGQAPWFTVPALLGTGIFIIRMILMSVGGGGDLDFDGGSSMGDHGDSTSAFHFLSIQSLSAFAMGFGWGGYAAMRTMSGGFTVAMLVGLAIGVGFVWLQMLLLKAVADLQSSGNVRLSDTVGLEGDVYLRVPARGDGMGRVRLVVSERLRIFNAITEGEELPRSARVRVAKVSGNTLVVTAAT
ncbi:MAG: NfeD family protein [Phycisphaeraceae bacterium]|nr:NfeD family protein [Phycisphaeraceae bacterium]